MTNMAMIEGEKQNKRFLTVPDVARMAHEVNRAWCEQRGDMSQVPWKEAEMWQKDSANNGVQFRLDNPDATPERMHANWMGEKVDAGWIYGAEKNADANPPTHPCIVQYDDLPVEQQVKDHLFSAIVKALDPFLVRD